MRKLIYETIYTKLQPIMTALGNSDYVKLESRGYMDLNVDLLSKSDDEITISMAHNFIQRGDVMADPDMEIRIYPKMEMAEALTYQLDSLGIYQTAYFEKDGKKMVIPKLKKQLNDFLNSWLSNIQKQGFLN